VNDWDVALGTCEVVIIDGVPVESLYHWYEDMPVRPLPFTEDVSVICWPASIAAVPETEAVACSVAERSNAQFVVIAFGIYVNGLELLVPEKPGHRASEFTLHRYAGLMNPLWVAVRAMGWPTSMFDGTFG
jgi:hypothetical protein